MIWKISVSTPFASVSETSPKSICILIAHFSEAMLFATHRAAQCTYGEAAIPYGMTVKRDLQLRTRSAYRTNASCSLRLNGQIASSNTMEKLQSVQQEEQGVRGEVRVWDLLDDRVPPSPPLLSVVLHKHVAMRGICLHCLLEVGRREGFVLRFFRCNEWCSNTDCVEALYLYYNICGDAVYLSHRDDRRSTIRIFWGQSNGDNVALASNTCFRDVSD